MGTHDTVNTLVGRYNEYIGQKADDAIDEFRRGKPASVIVWDNGETELTTGDVETVVNDLSDLIESRGLTLAFRVRPATPEDINAVAREIRDQRSEALDQIEYYRRNGWTPTEDMLDAAAAFGEWF